MTAAIYWHVSINLGEVTTAVCAVLIVVISGVLFRDWIKTRKLKKAG